MAGRIGRRRVLRAITAVALAGAVAGIAACAPITTQVPYAPSDGIRVFLGDQIGIENFLILTKGEGEPALVVASITNASAEPTTLTLTFGEGGEQVTLELFEKSSTLLNPLTDEGKLVSLTASPVPAGAVLEVTIATAESGGTTAPVPVLDGTLAPYGDYIDALEEAGS